MRTRGRSVVGGRAGRTAVGSLVVVALVAAALVLLRWALPPERATDPEVMGVDTTPSTTVAGPVASSTVPPAGHQPDGPVAPLTGERVPAGQAQLLQRPALAVKIDNHPAAVPQWGLERADLVVEVLVEGISRFVAVYHSREAGSVGPVRSARTGDADLTALLGRPLFGWSGANPATVELVRSVPWLHHVDALRLPAAYRRDRTRSAPHNLRLDTDRAFAATPDGASPPGAVFGYLGPAEVAAGDPVPGVSVRVGASASSYVWDPPSGSWHRFAGGRRHTTATGDTLSFRNVVVLETRYETSPADRRSPEAVTVGEGRAWVAVDGRVVAGSWRRPSREVPWTLTAVDGAEVRLRPGPSVVVLSPGPPSWLDGPGAGRLAAR